MRKSVECLLQFFLVTNQAKLFCLWLIFFGVKLLS